MKKFPKQTLFVILILVLGIFLRAHSLSRLAPFDWDQNRDYLEVSKIASGKLTLIGPVARGEGGFFLGPLYYYLLTPLYSITGGNPISLPATSVLIDSLTIASILGLGIYLNNMSFGYIFALLWAVSPSVVDASRISWNVILIPLWYIGMVYSLSKPKNSNLELFSIGVLASLSWHIHAAIIPLAPIMLLLSSRSLSLFSLRIFYILIGYLLPISPLIIFDIRHMGLQSNLIKQMVIGQESVRQPMQDVAVSVISRYGKNLAMFFGGKSDLNLPLGLIALALTTISLFTKSNLIRLATASILLNLMLVLLLGTVGFPEYYLLVATIATVAIISYHLSKLRLGHFALVILVIYLLTKTSFSPTPYSLENKLKLVKRVALESKAANMIYDLPFGRESGIPILLKREGVNIVEDSNITMMISEKNDANLFIQGQIATELGYFGPYRLVKHELK